MFPCPMCVSKSASSSGCDCVSFHSFCPPSSWPPRVHRVLTRSFLSRYSSLRPVSFSSSQSILESWLMVPRLYPPAKSTGKEGQRHVKQCLNLTNKLTSLWCRDECSTALTIKILFALLFISFNFLVSTQCKQKHAPIQGKGYGFNYMTSSRLDC